MRSQQRLERIEPFAPLRPETRRRLIVRAAVAPLIWVVALIVVAVVVRKANAIELAILIVIAVIVLSSIGLVLLRIGRDRQRTRYASRR
jgi:hypothetical protein